MAIVTNKLSEKARAFLAEPHFAVLGTINENGTPQLTTMWYVLDGDTIIMNTKVGRAKERNMKRDPHIAVCVEDGYNYVTISGTVEMNYDQKIAHQDIYRLAVRYDGEESAEQQMNEVFLDEERVTLRLKCNHIIENL